MSNIHDFSRLLTGDLSKLIEAQISQLLATGAERHDHHCGVVKGLQLAKNKAEELTKTWTLREDAA